MFSGLPCESHIAHIARIARTRDCEGSAAWCLPGIASLARHLPGIGALPSPRRGRDSSTEVGFPTSLSHQGRNSDFAFLPEKPITGPAPKVWERRCPRSIADRVFFHHSHAAVNPGVATGLPLSSLARAQDCSLNPGVGAGLLTQSWRGHRNAPLNPAVATGLLQPILCWQQDCPGALRAARAWNCSCPSTGLPGCRAPWPPARR